MSAGGAHPAGHGATPSRAAGRAAQRGGPTWLRWAGFAALILLTIFVARSCQQSQVRITEERAIATARAEVGFTPERTQIRLVRQGLNARPYWAVSLSSGADPEGPGGQLAIVRIDANTGTVESVATRRPQE
jgi:hypothetical protein